ncbi:MAG TPA: M20/M25/M40 family metallo-hydrolase [Elusimicrobiota bacterium]|nr:M20/M25/M40 family metallo-hydrolase [Elusimicrobiota bacterium]
MRETLKSATLFLGLVGFAAWPLWAQNRKAPDPLTDETVAVLKGYVRIDTANPPGRELRAAEYLRGLLEREDIPSEIFVSSPGRANLLARLKAEKPTQPPLLLIHHMDVVPADPAEWSIDPFAAKERDGYLWGRGALDSKITGALHLMTLFQLKREDVRLNRDVLLLAVADEEAGGRWGSQWMVENHWDRMKPGFVIDEGGFGLIDVFSYDPVPVYACAVDEKKVLWLKLTANGRSGHGSVPNTDNPIDVLRKALARMEQTFIRFGGRTPEPVRDLERAVPHPRKSPLLEAVRHNSLSVTSFQSWSGAAATPTVNVIPDRAVATLDCRLLPGEDEQDLLAKLRRAVDDDRVRIEVTVQTRVTSDYRDYRSPLYDGLVRAVRRHDEKAVVAPFLMPGATDSRFFRAKGVRCYGLVPLVLTEEEYLLMHASDERLPLDRLEKARRIMYDWVKNFCLETDDGVDGKRR